MSRMFSATLLLFGLLPFCCAQRGAMHGSGGGGMHSFGAVPAADFRSAPSAGFHSAPNSFAHFSSPRFASPRIAPARIAPRSMTFAAGPRVGFVHPRATVISSAPSRRGVFTFGHGFSHGGPSFNTRHSLEFHHHHRFPHAFLFAVPYYSYGFYDPFYDNYWNPYYSFGTYGYDPSAGMGTYTDLSGQVNDLSAQVQQLRDENDSLQAELDESRQPPVPAASTAPSASSGPPTVLVYSDGHQIQVQNYAIVGQTLWILSDNRASKVPLADLDLKQTIKINEDRGVEFLGPSSTAPKQ